MSSIELSQNQGAEMDEMGQEKEIESSDNYRIKLGSDQIKAYI